MMDKTKTIVTQLGPCRQSMNFFDSSIFETSDTDKLVKYIRQKRGINNAQRIFDNSPANEVAERSFPIEIQPIQEKAKAASPSKHAAKEATSSQSRIPRIRVKRISAHRESIGKRVLLKELEKASGEGTNFQPAAFSTPNSVVINEDSNISGISRITQEEEIPETQEPNEAPKNVNDYFQKITEDDQEADFNPGMRYSGHPPDVVHQQEETLKNSSQVDKATDNATLVNSGFGIDQDKAKSRTGNSYSLRSKQTKSSHCSALSQQMPLNEDGRSGVQQNALEMPSDSDTCLESGDDERSLARNQNNINKCTAKMSPNVERSTEQVNNKSPNRLSNSSLRTLPNENVKQTAQQAVFEEPYSNLNPGIKPANNVNKEDQNSNRKSTDRNTSTIEHNSRRSRVTASAQVQSAKEIVQTSQHFAFGVPSNSDSDSEDDYENPVPEKDFKERKDSKNKSVGQSCSNRNLNSRRKVKSSDCPARSIQAITLDRYNSNSSSEEDSENCKENQNPKKIRGRTLSRTVPSSRRSKVKHRNRLLQEVPISSNKKTEAHQQIASDSTADSKKDFPKEKEMPRKSTGHASSRIEQNSKNIRVVSMDGRDKPLIYMPVIQNFHKETEHENGRADREKKCENATKKVTVTKDVGCQKDIGEFMMTSDEEVANITDQVLIPRKHKNKKVLHREINTTNYPETNRTDSCGDETEMLHLSLESSDANTVENFNDKVLAVSLMQQNAINAMNKGSQKHSQIGPKGKKRLSQMDPIKQEYLDIGKKLRRTAIKDVNISRRKLYSKGNSDNETSESSDISAKFSQETPVLPHAREETRKMLNFSRNPRNEKVSNKTAQRSESIDSCIGDLNNEKEFTDSTSTVDAVNKNDIVFKKPMNPVSKPSKRKIGKKGNQKDTAKSNSNKAMQDSNSVISMEEKHQTRLVSRSEAVKTNVPKEPTYDECNSPDLPVEPDEADDHPTEPAAISRTSVKEKSNSRKAGLSDIPENTKSMLRRSDEAKENDAEPSQKNKKEKKSHGGKRKTTKSSHPPSDELNEQLRRSTRQRKSPIPYWSCRLQHFALGKEDVQTFSADNNKKKKMPVVKNDKTKIVRSKKALKSNENKENSENFKSKVTQNNVISKDAADRVAMNESQIACEFDRLKESFSIEKSRKRKDASAREENVLTKTIKLSEKPSAKVAETNEILPNVVNQQETPPVSSDDGISTSEENNHPKPPWCVASLRTPTTDSGNQTGATNDTHVNKENRLFLWLKNLSTPRMLTRNKDVVQVLNSNTIRKASAEDLTFQEINGVEYAYYLGEDNNYGYMKFHPHSEKPGCRTKNVELKFLSLVGSLQMKIGENLVTVKNGDLVTVPKGVRYSISNASGDPAVLFFNRIPNSHA